MKVLNQEHGKNWSFYNADCVTFTQGLPDNCFDLQVFSPPYSSLYVYSESVADMGNVANDSEFFEQYRYLVKELYRTLRPGRICAIHVKDLVYYQNSSSDGSSGLRAFSDGCTRIHMEEGFTFHCRITINRDPVLERAKTNAHGLLWKTFQSDASFCRVGMPEYLMVYRKWAKPGEEELVRPVLHPKNKVPLENWQDLAYPTWYALTKDEDSCAGYPSSIWNCVPSGSGDHIQMRSTDVLNVDAAKDDKAEKHLCPMPLNITKRAIDLWTNREDVVFSPFGGIGSEGAAAIDFGRKYVGTELHPTYWRQGCKFLAEREQNEQLGLSW